MKRFLIAFFAALAFAGGAFAAGGPAVDLAKAPGKTTDMAALQNGAKVFANYCLSCHSAAFMRYNRLTDIGLTEQQIKDNLLFTGAKVGDVMRASINPREAKDWFGANPPDLTLITRSRNTYSTLGTDYIYTLLRYYYRDETKVTGWNNLAFPNIGMPHVLWELQGERKPVFEKRSSHGHDVNVLVGWEQVKPGTMSTREYDQTISDLVAYLQWMSEPNQNRRVAIGAWVILFLGVFTVIAWRLNAAYWKDVK